MEDIATGRAQPMQTEEDQDLMLAVAASLEDDATSKSCQKSQEPPPNVQDQGQPTPQVQGQPTPQVQGQPTPPESRAARAAKFAATYQRILGEAQERQKRAQEFVERAQEGQKRAQELVQEVEAFDRAKRLKVGHAGEQERYPIHPLPYHSLCTIVQYTHTNGTRVL